MKFSSLFSGAGGLDLGLEEVRYRELRHWCREFNLGLNFMCTLWMNFDMVVRHAWWVHAF